MRILIVEDDPILLDGLSEGLKLSGFVADGVATAADATEALRTDRFDAVVLDRMLPDGSGLDVLSSIRRAGNRIPVLLLTAKDEVGDRIDGLDAGADDYLGKPFDLDEVAARLRAITRRAGGRASATIQVRELTLDPASMQVSRNGMEVSLSRREFSILHALMESPQAIHSKQSLEERLYGWQEDVESNTIEVHIHKLRAKLGSSAIETVRGVGYRLGVV
ncbi:response regulator (plasmid) [Agrobacterium radiobacter]|uniref:response regulator n=1 Tax=Agrobacterium tumefaciens complex TaxID=1183400 RepID=UPI00076131EF|nr:response regulator transcription factor [Agrobacterium tumefaciens]AYM09081.1 two-component system, OmpR family, response regulator QseB [Agrobacterium tumefaciens]KWT81392.1 two-component system response regulator [Agrobacterium tumefaciens str. B6]MQB27532.1 DNA-binding response regulator [Agrobacterium tumefaciens]NSZ33259.1 response regulator transcription factor [Agrobacterium tumefaciens]NTA05966.1 response regulator transcription factor [Agrobacterium tumefaciens]